MGKFTTRFVALAVLATAWVAWPSISTHPSQKIEWVVESTPAFKGHPIDRPHQVECVNAANDLAPPKYVTVTNYAHLNEGDACPAGQ